MSAHEYAPGPGFRRAVQKDIAWRFQLGLNPGADGRHRLPDTDRVRYPHHTVFWSEGALAWLRRVRSEGKYPRLYLVVATQEEYTR